MQIRIRGAHEHNLKHIDLDLGDGLTVVTGSSGSGKTSLMFDTLYHEARSRYMEVFSFGSPALRPAPALVDSITGLGPAVAVGQDLLNRNPASTLASASGLHPLLRLLYARFGVRTCENCRHPLHTLSEDEAVSLLCSQDQGGEVAFSAVISSNATGSHRTLLRLLKETFGEEALLIDHETGIPAHLDPHKPHRIEVLVGRFSSPPDAAEARRVFQYGVALGAAAFTLRRPGQPNFLFSRGSVCANCGTWFQPLEPGAFNRRCPHCDGAGCERCAETGMLPQAASVRWEGLLFPQFLALPITTALRLVRTSGINAAAGRLGEEITRRLETLATVGLGYLSLDRSSPTLSRGEAQRVRLAVSLASRLEDILHVLDEPTIGQHPADVRRLLPAFRQLKGPVVFVEHDRLAAAEADRAIDLGPGAGENGGRILFDGTPAELWRADTPSGRCFSLRQRVQPPELRPTPKKLLHIHGANLRTLKNIDIDIPLGCLTVITGVSGSGKSTLVEDVLHASLQAGKPAGCRQVEGLPLQSVMVTQDPIGRNPRSNPATYTKLSDILRDVFAANTTLSASHFSFNRPEGACPECAGMGEVEVRMTYLPFSWVPCPSCGGARFSDEVLNQRICLGEEDLSIAEIYDLPVSHVRRLLHGARGTNGKNFRSGEQILAALEDIGLGYLRLGQPSPTLSGGEAQRVKLAKYLGKSSLKNQVLILDEPSTGLHPQDIGGLLVVFNRLARAGATLVVVEHNTDVIRAADWLIELGPGAGEDGGNLLYSGSVDGLLNLEYSPTGKALREEDAIIPRAIPDRSTASLEPAISIRRARAHNLKNVDVDFPKGKLTVITGVSGSGKSSLVHDVLEIEARRRFLESLSMYERQSTHEGAEAPVDSISGLGVSLSISPERRMYERRATVGVASEISHHLAVILAKMGERTCLACGAPMERRQPGQSPFWHCPNCGASAPIASPRHFSPSNYAAACLACNGVGTHQVPVPEKLIIHPEKPLCSGAMYSPGFFPQGYLCKPGNGGYYLVRALAERYQFDPDTTPWNEMTPEAQQAFLFGDPTPMHVHGESHSGRMWDHEATYPGFYGFIRDWDVGGTYSRTEACPSCHGGRLRPEYAAVTLGGLNLQALGDLPLSTLSEHIDRLAVGVDPRQPYAASLQKMRPRLAFLCQVGVGYLHLDRVAATLSAGEAQRVRLAGLLGSGLTSLTLLLDEPTRGLHPAEVEALLGALQALRDEGNTVIVIEHAPIVFKSAALLVDMGPGSGAAGGRVVARGTLDEVKQSTESITAAWLTGKRSFAPPGQPRSPHGWMHILGARANNLVGDPVDLPLGVLVGVCGASGSGKSTLILDTLGRALSPKKQTTSVAYEPVEPGEYDHIEGAPSRVVVVEQTRTGIHAPISFLGIEKTLRSLYVESEEALALGVGEEQLKRSCTACGGTGVIRTDMGFLPDVLDTCEICHGSGYQPEAWRIRLRGYCLPELDQLNLHTVLDTWKDEEALAKPLAAACDVGLG